MGASYFCKGLVILGLTLSWAQVLILPLDVANSHGLGGGLDISLLWMIIYLTILVMVTILLPFAIFLYESDDELTPARRVCYALQLEFCTLVVVCLILFISWAYLKYADIPVEVLTKPSSEIQDMNDLIVSLNQQTSSPITLEIEVGFPVYVMGILSFIGWIVLVFFGGLGLPALPMDLIMEFVNRPQIRKGTDI